MSGFNWRSRRPGGKNQTTEGVATTLSSSSLESGTTPTGTASRISLGVSLGETSGSSSPPTSLGSDEPNNPESSHQRCASEDMDVDLPEASVGSNKVFPTAFPAPPTAPVSGRKRKGFFSAVEAANDEGGKRQSFLQSMKLSRPDKEEGKTQRSQKGDVYTRR